MFEKIRKIKIKGNNFFEDNLIEIFGNDKERYSFIYGNNGSGKSTISKAFSFLKGDYNDDFETVELLDGENNLIPLNNIELDNIYIYNEEFIDNYVKIKPDGMSAIVMFGEQVKIDEQIKILEEQLNREIENKKKNAKKMEEYNNEKSVKSPLYFRQILENKIKSIWYLNDMKIRKLAKKSPYSDKIFEEIKNTKNKKDVTEEEQKLRSNLDFINSVDNNMKTYNKVTLNYLLNNKYDIEIKDLIMKKIEKPELTEREKKIFDVFTSTHSAIIYEAKDFFKNDNSNYCPYCFQNITDNYKDDLLKSISKVLSDEIEDYKEKLNNKKLLEMSFLETTDYIDLDKNIVSIINKNIKAFNDEVLNINATIDNKIDNIYENIKFEKTSIVQLYEKVNESIGQLNNIIESFNGKVENYKGIQNECKELNTIITRNKLNTEFETYNKVLMDKEKTEKEIEKSNSEIEKLMKKINELNAQKKNYAIAMEEINNDLKYIFMDNSRLYLEHENGKYIIKSRKKKVSPNKVSIGERNAIALSYFFNIIKRNSSKKNEYKKDFMLIIDDPVSSFDNDNKIGIYSFIRSKINKINIGNKNNKLLIMSHSIEAMYNFSSFENDFGKNNKEMFGYKELKNKHIFQFKKMNNIYNVAFNKVFDYANEKDESTKYEIGNIIRKVLEGFSTFEFRCGFHELTRKQTIIDKIPLELKDYYENLMYRLFLNGDSHFVNMTYSMLDADFILNQNEEDRINITKSLIVLIYIINDIHVEGQLQDQNKINIIRLWKTELIESQK